jgi:hypothetical protein
LYYDRNERLPTIARLTSFATDIVNALEGSNLPEGRTRLRYRNFFRYFCQAWARVAVIACQSLDKNDDLTFFVQSDDVQCGQCISILGAGALCESAFNLRRQLLDTCDILDRKVGNWMTEDGWASVRTSFCSFAETVNRETGDTLFPAFGKADDWDIDTFIRIAGCNEEEGERLGRCFFAICSHMNLPPDWKNKKVRTLIRTCMDLYSGAVAGDASRVFRALARIDPGIMSPRDPERCPHVPAYMLSNDYRSDTPPYYVPLLNELIMSRFESFELMRGFINCVYWTHEDCSVALGGNSVRIYTEFARLMAIALQSPKATFKLADISNHDVFIPFDLRRLHRGEVQGLLDLILEYKDIFTHIPNFIFDPEKHHPEILNSFSARLKEFLNRMDLIIDPIIYRGIGPFRCFGRINSGENENLNMFSSIQ